MRKNDEFELEIIALSDEGLGIGRQDGFVWFVKGALPGDRVLCRAIKVKKSYGFARLQALRRPSKDRIPPRCSLENRCGGCQLQALSYAAELRLKENKVREDLLRIGEVPAGILDAVMEPIVAMQTPARYRNKAQVPIANGEDGRPVAGFYAARSHRVIPWLDCDIGAAENARILAIILRWMERFQVPAYEEESGKGLIRRALIRQSRETKGYMLCLIVSGKKLPHWEELLRDLQAADDEQAKLETLVLNVNTRRDNVIFGDTMQTLYGKGYIEDKIGDIRFRISPHSFYQVNPVQTEAMYGAALEFANLNGTETVWDLYCGIGTISLFLARQAKKVYGVEIVPEAVQDATENAARNGIENAEFFTGAAEEVLPAWQKANPDTRIDVITVDPPRKGCDETALRTMVELSPERIVYVSCNPATLARDIKYLRSTGYEVQRVRPVDNFPRTVHVETVCLLSKLSEAKNHISVKVDMDEMDVTAAESKATYHEIQDWVQEKYGFHVSHLNIAKTKRKCGIIERQNYNLPKSEESRSPETPEEKKEAIIEAFKAFQMIKP